MSVAGLTLEPDTSCELVEPGLIDTAELAARIVTVDDGDGPFPFGRVEHPGPPAQLVPTGRRSPGAATGKTTARSRWAAAMNLEPWDSGTGTEVMLDGGHEPAGSADQGQPADRLPVRVPIFVGFTGEADPTALLIVPSGPVRDGGTPRPHLGR